MASGETTLTFLVCHCAWSAGWAWRKMRSRLHAPPRSLLFTPTLTGVGERAHLAAPQVDLDTHIRDVLGVIEMEDLSDITLIGHSYGGMVATGVADRAHGRITRLIYLDAFVPQDGKSLYGLIGTPTPDPANWRVPPRPTPPDTSEEDVRWVTPRRMPQPLATFTTPLRLTSKDGLPPRGYIRCTRAAPDDPLAASAAHAREAGWPYVEIDASHNPHVTAPDLLAKALADLVGRMG
jgi:pimeloyl-ACP methyl ester carboxylesterase